MKYSHSDTRSQASTPTSRPTPDQPGHDDPGEGRRLALDVGTVRIGVAVSDRAATLATPVETIPRRTHRRGKDRRDKEDIDRIIALIEKYEIVEVIIGLPRDLHGHGSSSVAEAEDIARRVRRRIASSSLYNRPRVRMADERLTTVLATQALKASGVSTKRGRAVVDQAAAVEILQTWLDGRHAFIQRAIDDPTVWWEE